MKHTYPLNNHDLENRQALRYTSQVPIRRDPQAVAQSVGHGS